MLCEIDSILAAFATCPLLSRSRFKTSIIQFERSHGVSIVSWFEEPTGNTWALDDLVLIVSFISGQWHGYNNRLVWSLSRRHWRCTRLYRSRSNRIQHIISPNSLKSALSFAVWMQLCSGICYILARDICHHTNRFHHLPKSSEYGSRFQLFIRMS